MELKSCQTLSPSALRRDSCVATGGSIPRVLQTLGSPAPALTAQICCSKEPSSTLEVASILLPETRVRTWNVMGSSREQAHSSNQQHQCTCAHAEVGVSPAPAALRDGGTHSACSQHRHCSGGEQEPLQLGLHRECQGNDGLMPCSGPLPTDCHRQHTVWNHLSQSCQAPGGHQCHSRQTLPLLHPPPANPEWKEHIHSPGAGIKSLRESRTYLEATNLPRAPAALHTHQGWCLGVKPWDKGRKQSKSRHGSAGEPWERLFKGDTCER